MKMEPIERSETSASNTQTPGNYPKETVLQILTQLTKYKPVVNINTIWYYIKKKVFTFSEPYIVKHACIVIRTSKMYTFYITDLINYIIFDMISTFSS
jgi:hypothetical protein